VIATLSAVIDAPYQPLHIADPPWKSELEGDEHPGDERGCAGQCNADHGGDRARKDPRRMRITATPVRSSATMASGSARLRIDHQSDDGQVEEHGVAGRGTRQRLAGERFRHLRAGAAGFLIQMRQSSRAVR
jgi:hypothetical protein